MRRPLAVAMLALSLTAALAQSAPEERGPLINFVFASQLGSSVYTTGDSTVQVYRIPYNHTIRSIEDHRWGTQLRFSVTPGFFDFRAPDILKGILPDRVSTITVVAGETIGLTLP